MPFFKLYTTNKAQARKSSVLEYEHLFRLHLLGSSGAGKSSLLERWVDDTFTDGYFGKPASDFKEKTIELENTKEKCSASVKIQLFDCKNYFASDARRRRNPDAFIVVFDTTSLEDFYHVRHWLNEIKSNFGTARIILAGTMADLSHERKVIYDHVEEFINDWNGDAENKDFEIAGYVETSSKNAVHVDDLFEMTARSVMDERGLWEEHKRHPKQSNETNKLVGMLDAYINRIESYRGAGSDIDYSHGFLFFSKSRAINRKINYLLAKELRQELVDEKDISQVFHDLEERRKTIMVREGLDRMADYVDRGMNSSDLTAVIKLAEQIIRSSEAGENKTTRNTAVPK